MAKTKREIIIATFIVSCAATVISIVSMATQQWVLGDIKANKLGLERGKVTYGLFSGTLTQFYLGSNRLENEMKIACIFGENICGYSTAKDGTKRNEELKDILNAVSCRDTLDKKEKFKEPIKYHEEFELDDVVLDIELLNKDMIDKMRYIKAENITDDFTTKCDPIFLNGGLWIMTIFFLSLSIVLSALTATLSIANTTSNPISPWLNIWGLYIWNGLSSVFILITLILWGAQYAVSITENLSVVETLNGFYSNDTTALGFSYWLLLAPLFFHLINIGLFYLRQYLIDKEPEIPEEKFEAADRDGMIFVY